MIDTNRKLRGLEYYRSIRRRANMNSIFRPITTSCALSCLFLYLYFGIGSNLEPLLRNNRWPSPSIQNVERLFAAAYFGWAIPLAFIRPTIGWKKSAAHRAFIIVLLILPVFLFGLFVSSTRGTIP